GSLGARLLSSSKVDWTLLPLGSSADHHQRPAVSWAFGTPEISLTNAVIVVGTVAHAMLNEGTTETVSKASLCVLVFGAAIKVMADLVRRLRAASRGQALPRQSLSRM
ncbi:MAG: hypothetical protein K0S99_2792, partial [Thermomicrobiales bacterium]|nr:hypothetical protein [Thermomicrobiales bacterium]